MKPLPSGARQIPENPWMPVVEMVEYLPITGRSSGSVSPQGFSSL